VSSPRNRTPLDASAVFYLACREAFRADQQVDRRTNRILHSLRKHLGIPGGLARRLGHAAREEARRRPVEFSPGLTADQLYFQACRFALRKGHIEDLERLVLTQLAEHLHLGPTSTRSLEAEAEMDRQGGGGTQSRSAMVAAMREPAPDSEVDKPTAPMSEVAPGPSPFEAVAEGPPVSATGSTEDLQDLVEAAIEAEAPTGEVSPAAPPAPAPPAPPEPLPRVEPPPPPPPGGSRALHIAGVLMLVGAAVHGYYRHARLEALSALEGRRVAAAEARAERWQVMADRAEEAASRGEFPEARSELTAALEFSGALKDPVERYLGLGSTHLRLLQLHLREVRARGAGHVYPSPAAASAMVARARRHGELAIVYLQTLRATPAAVASLRVAADEFADFLEGLGDESGAEQVRSIRPPVQPELLWARYDGEVLEGEVRNSGPSTAARVTVQVRFLADGETAATTQDFAVVPGGDGRALQPGYLKHFTYGVEVQPWGPKARIEAKVTRWDPATPDEP
jgi:hypothetical protein